MANKIEFINKIKKAAATPTPGRVAWEQALRDALVAGQEKEGELTKLATTSLEFEFHLQFPRLSVDWAVTFPPISVMRKRVPMETNIEKHVRRVMTLLMPSPPISISHRLFRCRYSNSRDVLASSLSFSRPTARVPRRACWQATGRAISPHEQTPS